jgi:hypothetical protein
MPSENREGLQDSKRELRFEGVVDYWEGGLLDVGPRIGERDVIGEIEELWPWSSSSSKDREVRVTLGVEPLAEGPLWAIHGFGGTDVTPPESPEITVGDFDLLKRLYDLDGRDVILIVEDV